MDAANREEQPAREKESAELIDAFLRASRLLVALSARSLDESSSPVTFAQFRALLVISRGTANNQTQLADELGVAPSSVTRMVDRLEGVGFVERARAGSGTRGLSLAVTERGQAIVDEVSERRRGLIADVVGKMDTHHVGALVEALDNFAEAGEEPPVGRVGSAEPRFEDVEAVIETP
ncbi:MarR family winged helix-turn-helix transcriptional regulator [Dietzia sp.]|uniref:MarR family winged helix-turn-helix transcriptional regulator n=1 Tax=Dietzia sp. TaxID=1871616 RepID=UPI002FDB49BA